MIYETVIVDNQDLRKVTRISVITEEGLEFEKYNLYENGVEIHLQDDGRTLKIFPRQEEKEGHGID